MNRLLGWAQDFGEWAGLEVDLGAVSAVFAMAATDGTSITALHDHGFICGTLTAPWWNPQVVIAEELCWWAERDGMALLKHFETWAEGMGAHKVVMAHLPKNERLDPIYRRRGYERVDSKYVRAL